MAASCTSPSFVPLLFLFVTVTVETRPSPQRDDAQAFQSLFGSRLSSLILAPPSSDDIAEGSADGPAPSPFSSQEAVPRFFLDFLQGQSKMGRRNRKSMVGGRGCFGMKMDRIGTISGLGC
uniref:C-type natriuretic peptide 2 n=1 Tax=Sphaeramia orbicularis TaxID=375764 RepID=A0A673B8X9_9TELE